MANLSLNEDESDQRIEAVLEKFSRTPVRILHVILPTDNAHTYSRIKFWADLKFGKWA